jgi:hypothetical protein
MNQLKHPVGTTVEISKPRWMPTFLARILNKDASRRGTIIFLETGVYSNEPVYGVAFEAEGKKPFSYGVYFGNELVLK